MARKPNYNFERQERDRLKAIKAANKADAKREQKERALYEARNPGSDSSAEPPAED
jgi:hypothetical protein